MSREVSRQAMTVVRQVESQFASDPTFKEMLSRAGEMGGRSQALLTAIASVPKARDEYKRRLDERWQINAGTSRVLRAKEVILGGGLHAAIYAAVRDAKKCAAPLVIEASSVGGSFAVSSNPSFYLNSRNRPGPLGLPLQTNGSLNVLPGSALQPSHLSSAEYQRNSDLAFVIRSVLAESARVLLGERAVDLMPIDRGRGYRIILESGRRVEAERVIVATGMGIPATIGETIDHERILNFPQFMARFDQPFPLRGLGRVAVVGAGDSGKTVIEALVGQGPSEHMSVPVLDWVEEIDWYGIGVGMNCATWEQAARSRYKPLGRLLARPQRPAGTRVKARDATATISAGFECAYVNERPYDHIVVCVGNRSLTGQLLANTGWEGGVQYKVANRFVARCKGGDDRLFIVGPAANLPLTEEENRATDAYTLAPENLNAIFRYAPKTAALAAAL